VISAKRWDHMRLGFAVQLGTVRFLGTFLDEPDDVPPGVAADLARQLDIADPTESSGAVSPRAPRGGSSQSAIATAATAGSDARSAASVMPRRKAALRPAPPRLWQVTDAIARIQRMLDLLPDVSRLNDFLPAPGGEDTDRALCRRAAVASTLVAGLELARTGALALDQDAAWTAIRVGRRHDHRDAATAAA
jgi:hypothetical protein